MKSGATPSQFDTLLKQIADANQSLLGVWQTRVKDSVEPAGGFSDTYQKFIGVLSQNSGTWAELQQNYYSNQMKLWDDRAVCPEPGHSSPRPRLQQNPHRRR